MKSVWCLKAPSHKFLIVRTTLYIVGIGRDAATNSDQKAQHPRKNPGSEMLMPTAIILSSYLQSQSGLSTEFSNSSSPVLDS